MWWNIYLQPNWINIQCLRQCFGCDKQQKWLRWCWLSTIIACVYTIVPNHADNSNTIFYTYWYQCQEKLLHIFSRDCSSFVRHIFHVKWIPFDYCCLQTIWSFCLGGNMFTSYSSSIDAQRWTIRLACLEDIIYAGLHSPEQFPFYFGGDTFYLRKLYDVVNHFSGIHLCELDTSQQHRAKWMLQVVTSISNTLNYSFDSMACNSMYAQSRLTIDMKHTKWLWTFFGFFLSGVFSCSKIFKIILGDTHTNHSTFIVLNGVHDDGLINSILMHFFCTVCHCSN